MHMLTLSAANYHARALRHIRKRATINVAVAIATAMVGARMDYCNAIYCMAHAHPI